MQNPVVQLIVYGPGIGESTVALKQEGVRILASKAGDNVNYLFVDLEIDPQAKPGNYTLKFTKNGKEIAQYAYPILARDPNLIKAQGVTSADFIYLLMPDRFANGNKNNDVVKGMRETDLNRDSMYYRHGGDLEGVISKLDYLHDLGITALWMTPVVTNDMPKASYHGYANTENYHIDPRFGTNADYRRLGQELHRRQMKLIHDVVPNHVGLYHWTVIEKPFSDWLHEWPSFTQTSYKDQTVFDPYAADADRQKMQNGWFVASMPDLNQNNPYMANYIIQSHIWWIEYAGVDGFRIDTYPYNDLKFMAEWTDRIVAEYPKFTFFGETWVHTVPNQAYFLGAQKVGQTVDTKLMAVTDFQLLYGIESALNQKPEWTEGVNKLYNTLASDYQYPHPEQHVIFLDNHDKDRFFSVVGEHLEKYKSAMSWLLTTRGIPQIYYGAEILMKNFSNPDGLLRDDFKGGFPGDPINKFVEAGRLPEEQEIFRHIQKLAQYRKHNVVLQTGKVMQYVPEDGVYVYFRYTDDKTVMVLLNGNEESKEVSLSRFEQRLQGMKGLINIINDEKIDAPQTVKLEAKACQVFEIIK